MNNLTGTVNKIAAYEAKYAEINNWVQKKYKLAPIPLFGEFWWWYPYLRLIGVFKLILLLLDVIIFLKFCCYLNVYLLTSLKLLINFIILYW